MTTFALSFDPEPWSHDWQYDAVGWFGDPDEGPEHGVDVTILATSPTEAEQRALTYIEMNFDDPMYRGVNATASTEPVERDLFANRYAVRVSWPRR